MLIYVFKPLPRTAVPAAVTMSSTFQAWLTAYHAALRYGTTMVYHVMARNGHV